MLPYEQFAYSILEVRNPSEYDTELYSLDFDSVYLKDEEMVGSFPALEQTDFVLMPVRGPGEVIWPEVAKSYERKKRKEQLAAQLQAE